MIISAARSNESTAYLTISELAAKSVYQEVILTPKPGLVDRMNSGSHDDMNLPLFMSGIAAIAPWFQFFMARGSETARLDARQTFSAIRPVGLACEQAMFKATGGVNTHKGEIFSLGLLCAAAGRLETCRKPVNRRSLCIEVSRMCAGLVSRELISRDDVKTKGERIFKEFGFTGARGEAESGFITARHYAIPAWQAAIRAGYSNQEGMLRALLSLLANNTDTNIVSRGGLKGLRYVQRYASRLLRIKSLTGDRLQQALIHMDNALIKKHLSPGGSADLIAVTYFLSYFPE